MSSIRHRLNSSPLARHLRAIRGLHSVEENLSSIDRKRAQVWRGMVATKLETEHATREQNLKSAHDALQRSGKRINSNIRRHMPVWKRVVDILASLLGLVFLSPLFVILAVVIKVVSSGPVLFRQERLGYLGRPFTFWKFRTMSVDADQSPHRKHLQELINVDRPFLKLDSQSDSRIFPFGRFLRHSGLDELPQLFNILRGDMSLVGPRPCLSYEAQNYRQWQTKRFAALPGLTGLWQVSGKNDTTFEDMIRLDIMYTRKLSFWLDVYILLRTVPLVLKQISLGLLTLKNSDQINEEAS